MEPIHRPGWGKGREEFYEMLRTKYAKRYRNFDALAVQAGYNLVQTFAMGDARLSMKAQEQDMTLPGINVLCILSEHGAVGCPLNELSHLLLVSRANITGLVDSLAGKGFVTREGHAQDRRVILAKITKTGQVFLDSYLPTHYGEIRDMFSGLNVREKHTLIELLTKLRRTSCRHPREKALQGSRSL